MSTVSRIERGRADSVPMAAIHSVALALDAWADYSLRWKGGELDRVINARHAALHESVARWIASVGGWDLAPEVSFSVYGERGIVDLLAFHPGSSTLLVVELKSELVDISEMLGTFDRKVRLAPRIAGERNWRPRAVAAWVLLSESRTNHRRLADHRDVIRAALPDDGRRVSAWLRRPVGRLRAIGFLPNSRFVGSRSAVRPSKRVRGRRPAANPLEQDAHREGAGHLTGFVPQELD